MVKTYSIAGYGRMIADAARMDPYVRALRQAIKPGAVVLDIGAGWGVFALLACRFGARRVYAIEPDDSIHLARELASANGCADRIEFFQDLSTRVQLPERADVIVSDLRGVVPFYQLHIPSIADARRRFLAPGGVLIPIRDTVWGAIVEAPETYAFDLNPWNDKTYGLDFSPVRRALTNHWSRHHFGPGQLLVEPSCWATLDYGTVEDPNANGSLDWTLTRAGTGHGICVWFDGLLAEGVTVSNHPAAPETIYQSIFFPWPTPVALAEGDIVAVTLHANLVGEDYLWRWDSRVLDQGDPARVKARFEQSNFFGVPLPPGHLRKRSESHTPALSEDGQVDAFVLALMDGKTPLGDIARELGTRFPDRFPTWQEALNKAGDLSVRYGR